MKYDASMTQFHGDIVAAIKSMLYGDSDKAKDLAADSSPTPLREYLKKEHGTKLHGGNRFDCTSSCFLVIFDSRINELGETRLQMSWSQVTKFIRDNVSEIFGEEDKPVNAEKSSPSIEVLDLDVTTFNALKRAGMNTIEDIENNMEELENLIPKKIGAVKDKISEYYGIPIPGTWVEEDMLGDKLTFDEITNMVGEIIIIDQSTESHAWYKAARVERIACCENDDRRLFYFDGAKQRGVISEMYFDESRGKHQRAWRVKQKSDFPCDGCGYDEKGCCNYPETPDDYCVCGDKQIPKNEEKPSFSIDEEIPAPAQSEPTAFDYTVLDTDTAASLRNCETVIRTETAGYFTLLGAKFKEAQDLLANHSSGTFEQWYTAMGFKRQTVYNLIKRFEFSSSPTIGERAEVFEALPLTLSYEISKPDALAEKDKEISELKEEIARLSDNSVKSFVIKLTLDEYVQLQDIVKTSGNLCIVNAVKSARMIKL